MDEQHKYNEEQDRVIRELFKSFAPEEAPVSIRQNAMNRVLHEWVENPVENNGLINKNNKWWFILGTAAIVAFTFLADASVIRDYLAQVGIDAGFFSILDNNFKQLTGTIAKIPSLVYFVTFGMLSLLALDRLIHRLAQ